MRLRVVQDFFTVGAGSSDASSEAPEAEEDDLRASTAESLTDEGALLTMAKSDSAALIAKLARQRRAAALAAEKSGEEEAQEGGAAQPETGSMRLVPAAPHSPMSGTKLAAVAPQSPGAQWASSKSEEPADAEAEQGGSPGSAGSPGSPGSAASPPRHSGDEVVLTVPIAAIALLVYPPEPEPEPTPTKAPQQVAIDYEALSQEMKKLSHDFDEGGRAVVDDDDREEQQRIRNLKKTVLEDKAMVHAAVLERTASSPLTAEPEPTPEKVVLNGWQGATQHTKRLSLPCLTRRLPDRAWGDVQSGAAAHTFLRLAAFRDVPHVLHGGRRRGFQLPAALLAAERGSRNDGEGRMLWLERCRGAPPPRCLYRAFGVALTVELPHRCRRFRRAILGTTWSRTRTT